VSASGARAGSPAVTTKGVEGAHEPRTKADNPTSRIANRLRQQSIISLLKRLARTLQIGDLRIGLGQRSLSRRELIDAMREQHGYSSKTTDNNLSRMVRAKHPEVCRLDVPRGHYKLAPRVVEMLTAAIPQPAPLITSLLQGKEQAKKPVTDSDLMTSREVPEGTRREQPAEPAPAAEFPRENLGKSSPASDRKGSGHVPSLGIVTPRARGDHQPPRGATALAIGARVAKWSQAERRHLPGWEVLAIDGDTVTITNGTGRLDVPIDRLKPDTDAPPELAA
jgi:hypothetical protein